jgi:rhomboid family GlyGly-CTERM serine protease
MPNALALTPDVPDKPWSVAIRCLARAPITLGLTLVSLLLFALPGMSEALQFERLSLAQGELWRLATGHLTHWSLDHLFWDGLMFAALGFVCEMRDRWRFLWCVGLSGAVISLGLWLGTPQIATYRGLSGIDTALFALLAVSLLREKWRERAWGWAACAMVLILACLGKIAFEAVTGNLLFVDPSAGSAFLPLPWVHAAGAIVGGLVATPLGVRRLVAALGF